jgi:hypothetical protein
VPTPPVIRVDLPRTRNRINHLQRYVEDNLLNQHQFICSYHDSCADSCRPGDAFRTGTMSHVGRHFDLFVDDKPLRIVVVGQESGFPKDAPEWASGVTLAARYEQVHDDSGLERHYYREGEHPGRNPHMRGTTSALRVLLGQGLGTDYAGEFVHPLKGKPFHIFDGFALVNRLLCSAGSVNSSQGRPTATMFSNCTNHFSATLKILQPTIVILQGKAVVTSTSTVLERGRTYDQFHYEAHLGSNRMIVCTFSHPSAHGDLRWGDKPTAPYLKTVVAPTLRKALRRS